MNTIKSFFLTISVIKFGTFDFEQIYQIYSGFKKYNLTKEQVKVYAKKRFSSSRMSCCKHALAKGVTSEEMSEWLKLNLNGYVFRYVMEGRIKGIPKEEVQKYGKTEISAVDSFYIYLDVLKKYR